MKSLLKILLAIACLATGLQTRADDAFNSYVADVHLSESYQFRAPESVIRYTDGDKGALLKSILDPVRMKEMLAIYWRQSRQGGDMSNLPQLLAPLLNRYDKSFDARGSLYENEYLDSVEAYSALAASSLTLMNSAAVSPATNKDGSKPSEDQAKLVNSLNSMAKNISGILAGVNQQLAADIRKKISSGKFSADGAKRALKLADSLGSQR